MGNASLLDGNDDQGCGDWQSDEELDAGHEHEAGVGRARHVVGAVAQELLKVLLAAPEELDREASVDSRSEGDEHRWEDDEDKARLGDIGSWVASEALNQVVAMALLGVVDGHEDEGGKDANEGVDESLATASIGMRASRCVTQAGETTVDSHRRERDGDANAKKDLCRWKGSQQMKAQGQKRYAQISHQRGA